MDCIIKKANQLVIDVSGVIFPEGDFYIAYCRSLDLAAQGDDAKEASENFEAILESFFLDALERDTLDEVLKKQGWVASQKRKNGTQKKALPGFKFAGSTSILRGQPQAYKLQIPVE